MSYSISILSNCIRAVKTLSAISQLIQCNVCVKTITDYILIVINGEAKSSKELLGQKPISQVARVICAEKERTESNIFNICYVVP
jgi:hypothetical protein